MLSYKCGYLEDYKTYLYEKTYSNPVFGFFFCFVRM